jgi:hypothetical protein
MGSQKGKILSWVIFILLLLAVFGGLLYFQKSKTPSPEAGETVTEKQPVIEEDQVKVTQPRKKFAVPELSEEEKREQDNKAFRDALLSGEGCDVIEFDPELKQRCEDTLTYDEALRKKDEKLCETIEDEALKQECLDRVYLTLAVADSDVELCRKIKDEILKQSCLDQIQALAGRTAESAAACDVIQDANLKQTCLDNFYYTSSTENLSEATCENIQDSDLRERCSKTVAKNIEVAEITKVQAERTYQTSEEKMEGCDALEGEEAQFCKDEANYTLALEEKDLSYCNLIDDQTLQTKCIQVQGAAINKYYLRMATAKKDASLCVKILDEALRSTCLTYAQ